MAPLNWHSSANRAYPEAGFQDTYVNKEATMWYTNYLVPNEYSIVILHYETVLRTTTNHSVFHFATNHWGSAVSAPLYSHWPFWSANTRNWQVAPRHQVFLFWMEATFRARWISSTGPTESKSIAFSEKVVICVKSSWKKENGEMIQGLRRHDIWESVPSHPQVCANSKIIWYFSVSFPRGLYFNCRDYFAKWLRLKHLVTNQIGSHRFDGFVLPSSICSTRIVQLCICWSSINQCHTFWARQSANPPPRIPVEWLTWLALESPCWLSRF